MSHSCFRRTSLGKLIRCVSCLAMRTNQIYRLQRDAEREAPYYLLLFFSLFVSQSLQRVLSWYGRKITFAICQSLEQGSCRHLTGMCNRLKKKQIAYFRGERSVYLMAQRVSLRALLAIYPCVFLPFSFSIFSSLQLACASICGSISDVCITGVHLGVCMSAWLSISTLDMLRRS